MNKLSLIVVFLVFSITAHAQVFTPPFGLSYGMNKTQVGKILDTKPVYADGDEEYEKYYYYVTSKKLHGFSVKRIDCAFIGSKGLLNVAVILKYVSDKNFSNLKKVYTKIYGKPSSEVYDGIAITVVEWEKKGKLCIIYIPDVSYLGVGYNHSDFIKWINQK